MLVVETVAQIWREHSRYVMLVKIANKDTSGEFRPACCSGQLSPPPKPDWPAVEERTSRSPLGGVDSLPFSRTGKAKTRRLQSSQADAGLGQRSRDWLGPPLASLFPSISQCVFQSEPIMDDERLD